MTIVSTGYSYSSAYDDPQQWLKRTAFYNGILSALADRHSTYSIERINYGGQVEQDKVQYRFFKKQENSLWFNGRIHRYIRSLEPDLVLVNGFNDPLSLIRLRRQLKKTVKLVVIHRADQPAKGYKRWLQRRAAGMVDRYIFTDAAQAINWIKEGLFPSSKIWEVLPCSSTLGGQNGKVFQRRACNKTEPVFLWVGRLDANKDPLLVLKAFERYLPKVTGAKLYMIFQDGDLHKAVQNWINSSDRLKKAVVMVGRVEHDQMEEWYHLADYYISASHTEACGIALLEAMSCGCIPIVSSIPSFSRITGRGRYGLQFKPGNEEELYKALLQTSYIEQVELRREMQQYFIDHLSFPAIAKTLNQYLNTAFS